MSSSASAKTSTCGGRGGGGGEGGAYPQQDSRQVDDYQGPYEGMYMHTHVCAYAVLHTVLSLKDVSSCDMLWYCLHVFGVTCIIVYTVRMCA